MNLLSKFMALSILFYTSMCMASDIHLSVTGFHNNTGQVIIGLFNKDKNFPEFGNELQKIIIPAAANIKYTFKDIPAGRYAIGVIHDENTNNVIDRNFVGYPLEGYGFSNNAKGIFSPPSFKQAAFDLDQNPKDILIQLIY